MYLPQFIRPSNELINEFIAKLILPELDNAHESAYYLALCLGYDLAQTKYVVRGVVQYHALGTAWPSIKP